MAKKNRLRYSAVVQLQRFRRKLLLEGYEIYFVYYKKPIITYWYEDSKGNLTKIVPIKRSGADVTLNGGTVKQEDELPLDTAGFRVGDEFVIIQSGTGYHVPPDLDYGLDKLAIDYSKIGIGNGIADTLNTLESWSADKDLRITVEDGIVKYRYGTTGDYQVFQEQPVVYVIYKGLNSLTIQKNITSIDPMRGAPTFQFRVTQLTDAAGNAIQAPEAASYVVSMTFPAPGTRSATLDDLPIGDYRIEELGNIDYELIETTITRQGSAAEPLQDGTFRIGNGSIITVRFKNKNEPDDRRAFQTFADNRVTYE